MSFYGNITNTSRTQFQFDKIYPNRVEMENHKSEDGIYAGRFILIEYDAEMHMDTLLRVSRIDENGFYAVLGGTSPQERRITKGDIHKGTIVYTSAYETSPDNGYYAKNCTFYKCVSDYIDGNTSPAEFEEIDEAQEYNYITNYQLDFNAFGRGFDSTVWQKVYVGGQEKYIMIAELNTVVPTFEIEVDAPTQMPTAPHFDLESSDIYYKLHCQPAWGFRIKSARLERGNAINLQGDESNTAINYSDMPLGEMRSDETTVWTKEIYNPETGIIDTYYWHTYTEPQDGYTGAWLLNRHERDDTDKTPAAIYYNKAGFSVERNIIDDIEDCISIQPTGYSGQIYNTHENVSDNRSEAPDIQELSIMLPSIGNSIARMWNIVYGEGIEDDGVKYRNMDINWDSYDGLRMVNGTTDNATYDTENTHTLAGVINSVHDLMGMIIIQVDELKPENMDEKHIYYYNGKYYQKYLTNNYTEYIVGDGERQIPPDMTYREITWELNEFEDSLPTYCYKGGTEDDTPKYTKLFADDYFEYGSEYVTSNNNEDIFIEVHPKNYDPEAWYKIDRQMTIGDYQGEIGYVIELAPFPTVGQEYSRLTIQSTEEHSDLSNKKPYIRDLYYIYQDGTTEINTNLSANDVFKDMHLSTSYNEQHKYYLARINSEGDITFSLQDVYDPNTVENLYYKAKDSAEKLISCKNANNQVSIPSAAIYDDNIEFIILTSIETTRYFFGSRYKYYVKNVFSTPEREHNEEYNLSIPLTGDETGSTQYFIKSNNIVQINLNPKDYMRSDYTGPKYYVSNAYYYQLPNRQYTLDRSHHYSTDKGPYYVKDKALYVTTDPKGYFNLGSEWNPNVLTVPKGVKLSTAEPIATVRQLTGFARELNTIHGLILKMNQMLAIDDPNTRDSATVSGVINLLNDIIHKFDIIAPGQIMVVDDYGRVHSATYETDEWIHFEVDPDISGPKINITHEYNPTKKNDTESSQDEDNSDGTLQFETVTIDSTGHVTAKHIETVDLPHNFKNITLGNDSIVAKNHIATLNIEGDEWLSWTLDDENSKLSISHTEPLNDNPNGIIGLDSNQVLDFGSTTQIPKITYDSKGHIFDTTSMNITLPVLSIEGNAAAGYILSGVNANGTKLTKQQLTSVILDGYTGTKENVSAKNTLGEALKAITDTISSIKADYATDVELTNAINNLRNELTQATNEAISTAINTAINDLKSKNPTLKI